MRANRMKHYGECTLERDWENDRRCKGTKGHGLLSANRVVCHALDCRMVMIEFCLCVRVRICLCAMSR